MAASADHLAWEARRRPPAAIAALVAAVLTFAGAVWGGLVFGDVPRAGYFESLGRAAEPGAIGGLESLRVATYEYYDDHAAGVLLSTLLRALGLLALAYAITFLAAATRARREEMPRIASYLPAFGGILSALAVILSTVATILAVGDFLDGPRTIDAADEINSGGLLVAAQLINLPGLLALAVGIVLISINAMRAGLVTRFVGVLGVITGALLIIPLGSPLPIVQCFWLIMVGLLLLGRWPGGQPPAWETGEAVPWPSGAQMRARAAGQTLPEPAGADGAVPAGGGSRKKRKKRA